MPQTPFVFARAQRPNNLAIGSVEDRDYLRGAQSCTRRVRTDRQFGRLGSLAQTATSLARQVEDARTALDFSTAESEAENRCRRERATIEFIAATMAKLDETYDLVPASGSGLVTEFLSKASVSDSSEFRALRNYIDYLEDLAVGVNLGLFDLRVVGRTIGPRMVRAWKSYVHWIERKRVALSFPALYSDLEVCVETIRSGRSDNALAANPIEHLAESRARLRRDSAP